MELNGSTVSFGRHESFPLRFGWIAKGLDALRRDPGIFTREDATVDLGVGKNMVASIRYWLQAAQVVERGGRNSLQVRRMGEAAFGDEGDPYLEDEGTIWLLHWLLATNPRMATSIYWFFNHFHKVEFTTAEVVAALKDFVRQNLSARTAATTLKNDAALILRMYSRTSADARLPLEDALDSPLATLHLQERLDKHTWQAPPMDREEIPLHIFAFAVAELFGHVAAQQLAVEQLMYSSKNHCAPGAVFRMTEDGLIGKLDALCRAFPGTLRMGRTAGVYQLYKDKDKDLPPLQILESHYANRRGKLAA